MVKRLKMGKGPQQALRGVKLGRPFGDPLDVRTKRLAQRVHPHLMSVLDQRSREYGITRSQFVERILVDYCNADEGAQLDPIGRWMPRKEWNPRLARRLDTLPVSGKPLEIGKQVEAEADLNEKSRRGDTEVPEEATASGQKGSRRRGTK